MSLRKIDMIDVGTAFILLDITFSHHKTFTLRGQPLNNDMREVSVTLEHISLGMHSLLFIPENILIFYWGVWLLIGSPRSKASPCQ